MAAYSSLYNEDRNLLRIKEKERRNQEIHQEKEAFPEKIPLFGEPYKKAKGDELSSRIQNMLGNYEEMKEFLSTKSHPQCLAASEDRLGKPRYPSFPDKGGSIPSNSFHTRAHHQPIHTPASGPLSVGNISHNPKMAKPRMEPLPNLHAKSYGPPDSQHLAPACLGQEGYSSTHHKKGDPRPDEGHSTLMTHLAPERELSPFISSLPSPVPPLSPVHSNLQTLPRMQASNKLHSSSNNSKSSCPAKSAKDLVVKVRDKETPQDNLVAVTSLSVAPPQPASQTFPPPSLPSKSLAMQQKPTAYVRPMDGQDQAPLSESPKLKSPPEDYRPQTFEKTDLKVPAKTKLTRLKMPSQSVEQMYSSEVHCVEEILKEMTHSWPPPLTAIHTPSTAEPSKFPFPTKDSQHICSAIQNQKQYDTPSKTHPNSQQGTSMLEDDLQLSDSDDSENEQGTEKPPSSAAPPSAPQLLPEPVVAAHSSSAESESTSDSDSSSDSESESSSSESENEPLEAPAPEPEPPTTNKWQLDNWLIKVSQPAVPPEGAGSSEPSHPPLGSKGSGEGSTSQEHPESKDPPSKSSSRAPRLTPEGPHAGKRTCQKSPAQHDPPPRQTVGTKQPKKAVKVPAQADCRAGQQVPLEPGPPHGAKEQTAKDKPKVKTKGRPRAAGSRDPKPTAPAPSEKKKHKNGPPTPSKAAAGPVPSKDSVVPLTQSQGPPPGGSHGGRTSGCQQAVVVQEDGRRDRLLLPLRDTRVLSPLRDTPAPQSLVVKITLSLLTRIPQPPGKGSRARKAEEKPPSTGKKSDSEKRCSDGASKGAKKRKGDTERDYENKKIKVEKEVKSQSSSSSSSHKESSKAKIPKPSSEPSRKEMLPPPPVSSSTSSSSSSSSQKPAKPAHKRSRAEADSGGQDPPKSASSTKSSSKDASIPKHRKVQGRGPGGSAEPRGFSGDTSTPFPVPSLPNGNAKPGKPQAKLDKQQADFHMKEAKKLKYKAESMTDKVGKAFKYLEAVLAFIECGVAMESETPAAKAAYTVYSDTTELIRCTMALKSFSDATLPTQEKIFAVLCMRCQSLLNMAMFRCKKDVAIKYSRTLNEHFKSSSKAVQAPSPRMARSTGTPSPLSPTPSPASSVGSQSSAGSVGSGGVAAVSTPLSIQNMTSSYVTITSHVLAAFELWEQAEALSRKNREFFAQLSTKAVPWPSTAAWRSWCSTRDRACSGSSRRPERLSAACGAGARPGDPPCTRRPRDRRGHVSPGDGLDCAAEPGRRAVAAARELRGRCSLQWWCGQR
ncbi:LOW QUALITY PROTEIN: AF4/FMR2 family member 1 [Perognathus longimembris pacificus]|uniref:LOW QUALITY PROTEIN: AF4/FMR2 family member 1 n=1 Tax=Perognathus longimembris pacificus TaxID=214514 RepID=UPI002019A3F2|nr:LOW QUALITY PROTEIN: AF4/FMR2 family member 1 [Perognathus longimembris pacificus]